MISTLIRDALPKKKIIVGLFTLFVLPAGSLNAQQSPLSAPLNSNEPIEISADALEADNRNRTFIFQGNVKVVQGKTTITSEQLKVRYKPDSDETASTEGGDSRIRDIEAKGSVVILFDGRTAKAEKAFYSTESDTLTLSGKNTTIIDGKNTIRGARITLYRTRDRITVDGSQQGQGKGRVEAVFFPGKNTQN